MDQALTVAGAWVVALAIAVPIFALWWWARRNAPLGADQRDYTIGMQTAPSAGPDGHAEAKLAVATETATVASHMIMAAPIEKVQPMPAARTAPVEAPVPPTPMAPPVEAAVPTVAPAEAQPPATAPTSPAPTVEASAVPEAARPAPRAASRLAPEPPAPIPPARPQPAPEPPAPVATPSTAAPAQPETAAPAAMAPAVEPASVPDSTTEGANDLTRIFGIDAATATVLQAAGIRTYRDLAAADVRNLRQVMADAGHPDLDPTIWPQQARFAAGGKWQQLEKMQARFKGGQAA